MIRFYSAEHGRQLDLSDPLDYDYLASAWANLWVGFVHVQDRDPQPCPCTCGQPPAP